MACPVLQPPSLQEFKGVLWQKAPAVFSGCVQHWPACSGPEDRNWASIGGLAKRVGDKVVPVEVFRRDEGYLDAEVGHEPVRLADFLEYCAGADANWRKPGHVASWAP